MKLYGIERFDESFITVIKHDHDGYMKVAECGARTLFDIENYRFLDCTDPEDKEHYLILDFTDTETGKPNAYYELELKPFYDLVALYLASKNTHKLLIEEVKMIIEAGH